MPNTLDPDSLRPSLLTPEGAGLTWTRAVALYLLVAGLVTFAGLGTLDVTVMEGIVVDGARTMERTQEFAVPRLHGEIYSYKPPLAAWLALASFRVFGGESEWALRTPFAVCSLLLGLVTFWLVARVLGPRVGLVSGLATLTGVLYFQKLHLAEFDTPLAAGAGIAVVVACHNLASDRSRPWLWLLGYVALALGFLAKGVPALMTYGPGLFLAAWVLGRFRRLFTFGHVVGVLLFAAVVGSWIVAAWAQEGLEAFAQPFAEGQRRGFEWSLSEIGRTLLKPAEALAVFLPWTLVLPWVKAAARALPPESIEGRFLRASGSFAVAGVLTFMLVPSSETRYLLPLATSIGTTCAITLSAVRLRDSIAARRTLGIAAGVVGVAALLVVAGATDMSLPLLPASVLSAAALSALLVGGAFLRGRIDSPIAVLGALACVIWLAHTLATEPFRASTRSLREVALAFETHLEPGETLWSEPVSSGYKHSSLVYYLGRPVRTFDLEPGGRSPSVGDRILLFSDEPVGDSRPIPFAFKELESRTQRRYEFVLGEVVGSD